MWFKLVGRVVRTARGRRQLDNPRGYEEVIIFDHKLPDPILSRKVRNSVALESVPQTDTGRWGENPKALERTLVKELGKMTP